jgi:hypothetical protein
LHPDYRYFAALAARMLDDQLCEAIGIAEGQPATFRLLNLKQRQAFLDAMSAERRCGVARVGVDAGGRAAGGASVLGAARFGVVGLSK